METSIKNENLQTFEGFDRSPSRKQANLQNRLLATEQDLEQSKITVHTTQNVPVREHKPLLRTKTHIEAEKKTEKEQEELEYLDERSRKLQNSKVHNKGTVILQIMGFALLFFGYFIFDYVQEQGFLRDFKHGMSHLKVIAAIIPNLRYTVTLSLEELAVDNLLQVYSDSLYIRLALS